MHSVMYIGKGLQIYRFDVGLLYCNRGPSTLHKPIMLSSRLQAHTHSLPTALLGQKVVKNYGSVLISGSRFVLVLLSHKADEA